MRAQKGAGPGSAATDREARKIVPPGKRDWQSSKPAFQKKQTVHSLYVGSRLLAEIVPDDVWPNMWRIVWPDGGRSDMTNLTRSRDAAEVISDNPRLVWRIRPYGGPQGSPLVRLNGSDDAGWLDWPPHEDEP